MSDSATRHDDDYPTVEAEAESGAVHKGMQKSPQTSIDPKSKIYNRSYKSFAVLRI